MRGRVGGRAEATGDRAALLSEFKFRLGCTRAAFTSVSPEPTRELGDTSSSGSASGSEILGEASGDASDKVREEPWAGGEEPPASGDLAVDLRAELEEDKPRWKRIINNKTRSRSRIILRWSQTCGHGSGRQDPWSLERSWGSGARRLVEAGRSLDQE